MTDYRHVNEITELAASRIRWMIAAYFALAMFIMTLVLAAVGAI